MQQLNEVARMQQLAGINEIKINNPTFPKFEIEDLEDDYDEGDGYKIYKLSLNDDVWFGTVFDDNPNILNLDFGEEEEEDVNNLISILDKFNIPYEGVGDDEISNILINKKDLKINF